jgi:DNA modification methylase
LAPSNRTNVWEYAGVNTFRTGRLDELSMHPTVKPVALIADAIKDASKRSNIILDPFCGSGSTLIAAEKTGRRGHAIEIDPLYVDVAARRWQATAESRRASTCPGLLLRTSRNSEVRALLLRSPRAAA